MPQYPGRRVSLALIGCLGNSTRCHANGLRLLHRDRGFDAFEQHLGLRVVNGET